MLLNRPKIGVVVPCHNEATRLPVEGMIRFFEQYSRITFCFVNDGSTDNTQEVLEDLAEDRAEQVAIVKLESNRGKAEAIRVGIKHIQSWRICDFVGYWDADMSTPLSEIPKFIDILDQRSGVQFLCGSRIRRMGAEIERVWYRHYFGRMFATAAGLVLQLPAYDTQCGAKMIKTELATKLFDKPFLTTWLFDVELMARAITIMGRSQANQAIYELPLEIWKDKGESKIKASYFLKAPFELVKIFWSFRDIRI
jgi:dolichyl-phosphate beta-glucosyltransferase